jgi:small subunit ribosomal protein S21
MNREFKGLSIKPKQNESPDKLIKRFSKIVRADGILKDIYERSFYEKPSERKRRKKMRARFLREEKD